MIRLRLLPPLTRIVGKNEVLVDLDRAPLRLVLERALAQNGKFRSAVSDQSGLSHEYACLVNGDRFNLTELGDVEVGEGDQIAVLLPVAGGA